MAIVASAGDPDNPPGPPETTYSYRLEDIYSRLSTGVPGTQITFTEPISGPGSGTTHTLNEIMSVAPSVDDTSGATTAQVISGNTYWGLRNGAWGLQTGAMPDNGAVTIVPTTTQQTIAAGYHDGSGYVEGDADLVAGNIKDGVNLFGITGTYPWAPVPKTGQTISYTLGDDGDLEMGVAWPVPRFTDNGDGTVTDNLTGLIWLKNADCFGQQVWATAVMSATALNSGECGLSDGSAEGDWRLPNVREMLSLIDYGEYAPALPDDHPFANLIQSYYWSSTTLAYTPDGVWSVYMYDGNPNLDGKTLDRYVWPVRGGE